MELRNHPFMLYRGISIWPPAWIEHSEVAISIRQVELECCFANNNRGGTNSMKIWFLILSLVDCIVCPTEKPNIHYSNQGFVDTIETMVTSKETLRSKD